MTGSGRKLGITVGGGPAPGINAVIGAATIEAVNQGFVVTGFFDGFQWLCGDAFDRVRHTMPLDIAGVARIHFDGGSLLRLSRASLLSDESISTSTTVQPDPEKIQRVVSRLADLGITDLITIGGDDTAGSARFVSDASDGHIRVVHVPKTIDNDLPLPHNEPTFGFSTARFVGTGVVKNLMQDSKTTGRWYLVTAMGRKAGWLAMGIGQAAGATLTLIPEEFDESTTLQHIADIIEGAMLKRRVMGRPDGVVVVAEGLAYRLGNRSELQRLLGKEVSLDAAGHLRLTEVPLGELLKNEIQMRFRARGNKSTIITHELGYELRSADPTPGDMAYCRSLGHAAVRLLLDQQVPSGVMVTLVNGNITPMRFEDMVDPETNRMRIRMVNVHSDTYRVARAYMIRLEPQDLDNPHMLKLLAAEAGLTPADFRSRYSSVVDHSC